MSTESLAGYSSDLLTFSKETTQSIITNLHDFIPDAGESQITAWRDSINILNKTVDKLIDLYPAESEKNSIILEYTIPLESRRIDAVLLLNGTVIVIEFKGKYDASQADIDQASAYTRDLIAYHKECHDIPVKCALVLTRYDGEPQKYDLVDVLGPHDLVNYCRSSIHLTKAPNLEDFISFDSYHPLPSLISAARELFNSGSLKRIHRAATATEPTLIRCSEIVKQTAKRKRRSLILISGVPGSGKTLIGLQLAHAKYLDELAITRKNGEKPIAPAVFLSGNGPLVEVLQYELRSAGGDGKAFVRGVHDYVKSFTRKKNLVPPHHVLIYDEAQRAFDAEQVAAKHKYMPKDFQGLSEPELFIQFAERVPEWSVVVGLIGSGQEIHIGEEAGIGQWKTAIEKSNNSSEWDVFIPNNEEIIKQFSGLPNLEVNDVLELSTTIRFHLATQLYEFVKCVLDGHSDEANQISKDLEKHGYHPRLTHDLDLAKQYLEDRYSENPDARFGLVASAKDKELKNHGVPKGFRNPGEVRMGQYGKWYVEEKAASGSCTELEKVATEFGTQGLELDACLLAWGTDFIRVNGDWTNKFAAGYRDSHRIVDAMALRKNAYRVLLTRGRDACVVFIPPIKDKMRETYGYLKNCGFRELT